MKTILTLVMVLFCVVVVSSALAANDSQPQALSRPGLTPTTWLWLTTSEARARIYSAQLCIGSLVVLVLGVTMACQGIWSWKMCAPLVFIFVLTISFLCESDPDMPGPSALNNYWIPVFMALITTGVYLASYALVHWFCHRPIIAGNGYVETEPDGVDNP